MRSLNPSRPTHTVTCTLSLELLEQIQARAKADTDSLSSLLRTAIAEFLANPVPPPTLAPVFSPSMLPKRNRSIGLPIKSPSLRLSLDTYAVTNNLTVSAVVRRAAYEHTKPNCPNPLATRDAWGDSPKAPPN